MEKSKKFKIVLLGEGKSCISQCFHYNWKEEPVKHHCFYDLWRESLVKTKFQQLMLATSPKASR